MPSRKRTLEEAESSSSAKQQQKQKKPLTRREQRERAHRKAAEWYNSNLAKQTSTTTRSSSSRATTSRRSSPKHKRHAVAAKKKEEEHSSSTSSNEEEEEEEEVKQRPSKRLRSSPASERTADAAKKKKKKSPSTSRRKQELRQAGRQKARASYESGAVDGIRKRPPPAAAALTPPRAAAAARTTTRKTSPRKKPPVAATKTVPTPPPPTSRTGYGNHRKTKWPRRKSGPFNSPVPKPGSFVGSATSPTLSLPDLPEENNQTKKARVRAKGDDSSPRRHQQEEEAEEVVAEYRAGLGYAERAGKLFSSASRLTTLLLGGTLLATLLVAWIQQDHFQTTPDVSSPTPVVCYHDNSIPMADDDDQVREVVDACQGVPHSEWLACPTNAHCVGGAVVACSDSRYYVLDVDGKNNQCVLNTAAQKAIQDMVQLVHAWTVTDQCERSGIAYTVERQPDGRPMFLYSQVSGELEAGYDLHLLDLADNNKLVSEVAGDNNNVLVALHPSYPIQLPSKCRAKLAVVKSFQAVAGVFLWLASAVWSVCSWFLSVYWDVFSEFPIVTTTLSVVGCTVLLIMRRREYQRRRHRELQMDRAAIRNLVYQLLQADPSKVNPIIYLRDTIKHDDDDDHNNNNNNSSTTAAAAVLRNISRQRRMRAWDYVVSDLSKDNRVIKTTVTVDGQQRGAWYWSPAATVTTTTKSAATNRNIMF